MFLLGAKQAAELVCVWLVFRWYPVCLSAGIIPWKRQWPILSSF